MDPADFFKDFECGPYEPFSTSGTSFDSDAYINAYCISNLLRTIMYSINLAGHVTFCFWGAIRFVQLFRVKRHHRALMTGLGAMMGAPFFFAMTSLSFLFNEHYGLRFIGTSFGTACILVATTSVVFNWYQAHAACHFAGRADALIARAYVLSWLSHLLFTLPFIAVFVAGGYVQLYDVGLGNTILAVGSMIGAGYAVIVVCGIWYIQRRLLALIAESLKMSPNDETASLAIKIKSYARSQILSFLSLSLSTIAFSIYGFATLNSIWTMRYFFYFNQFFFHPGFLVVIGSHLYSTYDRPSSPNSSVNASTSPEAMKMSLSYNSHEPQMTMKTLQSDPDASMELFIQETQKTKC